MDKLDLIFRKEAGFMRQKLTFRFHDPNTEKDTYNALVKVFTEVGCKKLKDAITEYEQNKEKEPSSEQVE